MRARAMWIAVVVVLVGRSVAAYASPSLSSLYGSERASLGSFFGNFKLGQTVEPTLPTDTFGVELETNNARVDGVVISISDTASAPPCRQLRTQLEKAWGTPADHWGGVIWQARSRDRAATFEMTSAPGCRLHFYRLVPPNQWLNTSKQSSVPIWAIGTSIADLKAALTTVRPAERDPAFYPPSIDWEDVSINGDHAKLTAYYKHGKVIGIECELDYDLDLQAWKRLNALFGTPGPAVVQTDNQQWRWRRAPGIVLDNWVGDLPTPAPGQPLGTQDMHPTEPNSNHTRIVFGVKPPYP